MDKLNKMILNMKQVGQRCVHPSANQTPKRGKNGARKEQVMSFFHAPTASHTKLGVVSNNVTPHQIIPGR
jgi:hypothetical protein